MIRYKIEMEEVTKIEISACPCDKVINIHMADGILEGGNYKYTSFINSMVGERECLDLIHAFELALQDLRKIKQQ